MNSNEFPGPSRVPFPIKIWDANDEDPNFQAVQPASGEKHFFLAENWYGDWTKVYKLHLSSAFWGGPSSYLDNVIWRPKAQGFQENSTNNLI